MKLKYFKYIFILFAIAILLFAVIKIKSDEQKTEEKVYRQVEEQKEEIKEIKLGAALFDSINPLLSKNKNVQDISKIIFEPLITLTSDYKIEYCLAKELAKQNETTYIIKLKEDRKWADGQNFTAEDVKFTIEKLKSIDTIYSSNVQSINQIEVVDDVTLRIILNKEVPFFEYNLTFPILSNSFYSDKEFAADIVPIGTGMYKVSEVNGPKLILTKNENHPDYNTLKLEKITIITYESVGELYNAFKIGNIDIIGTQNSNLKEYIGTIGYLSKEMKGREHDFIALNTQNQVLAQVGVRKAIAYSIDKSNIISSIYQDQYYTSNFPLDYGNWLYNDEDTSFEYNTEHAKQILVDEGWMFSNRYWQKTVDYRIQKVSFNFVVKASDANKVRVAENIQAQLENQGIRINLIRASDAQYISCLTNKNYDMILCSMNLSISPDLTTFFGENNLANYYNDEVNNILNEVKNQTNEDRLKENYKRLIKIYETEVPYISLYNNRYTFVYNTNLVGTIEPTWFYQFYNIKDWHK